MANQWGRDSRGTAGTAGPGVAVLAVIVSLVLGAAGGYGYFRFSAPDRTSEIAALTAERDRLSNQLASQAAELDALSERLAGAATSQTRSAGEEGALAQARDRAAQLQRQMDRLAEEDKRQRDGEREALLARIAETEQTRDDALSQKLELEKQVAGLSAASSKTETALKDELQRLKTSDIPDLRRQVDERSSAIERLNAQLAAATVNVTALKAEVERLQAALAEKNRSDAGPTTMPDARVAEPAAGGNVTSPGLTPRDAAAVDRAIGQAPGLDLLADSKRTLLKSKLVSGECVTTSLEAVFDHVPVLALRNLIRDLKSIC